MFRGILSNIIMIFITPLMYVTSFDGGCTVSTAELTMPKSTASKSVSALVIPPITGSEKEKKCYSVRSSDNLIVHIFISNSTGMGSLGQRICAARKSTKGRYFLPLQSH